MNHLILLPHPGHPSAETTRYGSLAISLLKGPDSSSGCVAIWAVVDGVSCAISIGLLLDEDRLRSATALSQALERKIETFMEHETCRRPGLLRRPALQLVVMPGVTLSAELKAVEARTVEIAAREVEARVGLALPDFRVLWLDARVERAELAERYKLQESPETAVGQILNFHMNFLGFGPLNLKADEAGLVGQLEAQAAKLETLLQAAADPRASSDHEALAGVFSALRDLSWPRLGGPVPRESVHERPARGAAVV